jgi:hypothetical protein
MREPQFDEIGGYDKMLIYERNMEPVSDIPWRNSPSEPRPHYLGFMINLSYTHYNR